MGFGITVERVRALDEESKSEKGEKEREGGTANKKTEWELSFVYFGMKKEKNEGGRRKGFWCCPPSFCAVPVMAPAWPCMQCDACVCMPECVTVFK